MRVKGMVVLSVLGLIILWHSEGRGREWKPVLSTKQGDICFFDPESIENLPEGVIRVWVKTEKTDFIGGNLKKHVDEVTSGKKDKITGEIIQLIDINCSMKTFRVINLVVYDKNKEIKEYYNDPSEWDRIASKSVINYLSKAVC